MQNNNNKNNYETIVQKSNSPSKSKVKRNLEYIVANYENYRFFVNMCGIKKCGSLSIGGG